MQSHTFGGNIMDKCKHDACHCSGNELGADGYCSGACREQKMENGKCACGHPECR
jgi:hypothetical protein